MPAYDVNFNATMVPGNGVGLGMAVVQVAGVYVPSTAANRALAGRRGGICVTNPDPHGIFTIQYSGEISNALTLLGTGAATYVRANTSTGVLERATSPLSTDEVWGNCDAAGNLTINAAAAIVGAGGGQAFTASGSIASGAAVCLANAASNLTIAQASSANLANGGGLLGVATAAATNGNAVTAGVAGQTVAASVTGLGAGTAGDVAVNSSGVLYRLTNPTGAESVIGQTDAQGNVTIVPKKPNITAPRHVYNVRQYGAVADGVTDDYAAIAAAIAAIPAYPGTGVVHIPCDPSGPTHIISRPILISRPTNKFVLRGDSPDARGAGAKIATNGFHGPAVVVANSSIGHLPTGAALLTGTGNSGSFVNGGGKYIKLSDSPAMALNGLAAFSFECTISITNPGQSVGTMVANSSGGFPGDTNIGAIGVPHSAFGIELGSINGGNNNLLAWVIVNGSLIGPTVIMGAIPPNTATYIAIVFDGSTFKVVYGPSGGSTATASTAAVGTLTQHYSESVYLGGGLSQSFQVNGFVATEPTCLVDSVRISNFAISIPSTAPSAKFSNSLGANVNGANRTLLLLNWDQDVDVFTVGDSYMDGTDRKAYFTHRVPTIVNCDARLENLFLYSSNGAGLLALSAPHLTLEHCQATGYDGFLLENNCYFTRIRDCLASPTRFGLLDIAAVGELTVDHFQCNSGKFPMALIAGMGCKLSDCAMSPQPSCVVPLMITDPGGATDAFAVLERIFISSENAAGGTWLAAALFSDIKQLTATNCSFDCATSTGTNPPSVIFNAANANNMKVNFISPYFDVSASATSVLKFTHDVASAPGIVLYGAKIDGGVQLINGATSAAADYSASVRLTEREVDLKALSFSGDADMTVTADNYLYGELDISNANVTVTRNVVVPNIHGKRTDIFNNTSQSLVIKTLSGTGPTIAAGKRATVRGDGTNIVRLTGDV